MKSKSLVSGFFVLLLIFLMSLYTVTQGQHALLLRLGKLETGSDGKALVIGPGVHFKIPIINQVYRFDTRLQTLDIQSSRLVTVEKKNVIVDYYVKWKIGDLPLYFTRTSGDERQARILLEQQLNDSLRAQFGRRTITEVIADDRTTIMNALLEQADETAKNLGIDVIDVRIKRIDLPEEVSNAILEQMRAERQKVASQHRSQGKADAEAIRATADAEATVIVATAKAEGSRLRGQGDGLAARIYGDAYSKDANFYAFYRSLEAYKESFKNKQDILVLKPDSQFFKYFKGESTQNSSQARK